MTGRRILFVGAQADRYGASRMLYRMAAAQIRRGTCVTCVLSEDGPMAASLREVGAMTYVFDDVPVMHRKHMRSPLGWLAILRKTVLFRSRLAVLCGELRPDLIHTNTSAILPVGGSVAEMLGLPHVQHMREIYGGGGPLWGVYRQWLMRRSDMIVCVSHAVAAQMKGGDDKVRVVHDGFGEEDFTLAGQESVSTFRRDIGLSDGDPLVGIVGRIKWKRKGHEVFLRAAAQLAPLFPAVKFVIVGAPFPGNEGDETRLRSLADECGIADRVKWSGELPDTRTAFAAMDVAVTASVAPESFSNVTLEAMIQERAVVATATGGTPEQIVDGESGLLVPPDEAGITANAIGRLLRNKELRAIMGRNARKRAMELFTDRRMTDDLQDIYDRLPKRRARLPTEL